MDYYYQEPERLERIPEEEERKILGKTPQGLWELYKKTLSLEALSRAFSDCAFIDYPFGAAKSVEFVIYVDKDGFCDEYIKVTFFGGACTFRCANINSNSANFKEIGKLLDGGYYAEMDEVARLQRENYRLVFDDAGKPHVYKEVL